MVAGRRLLPTCLIRLWGKRLATCSSASEFNENRLFLFLKGTHILLEMRLLVGKVGTDHVLARRTASIGLPPLTSGTGWPAGVG
jgi:hypothetical protein